MSAEITQDRVAEIEASLENGEDLDPTVVVELLSAVKASRSEVARLRGMQDAWKDALRPSARTKGLHSGEYAFTLTLTDEDDEETTQEMFVPWVTVKKIMAAIRSDAARTQERTEKALQPTIHLVPSEDSANELIRSRIAPSPQPSADVVVVSRDEWEAAEMVLRAWNGGWREDKMISPFFAWNEIRSSTLRTIAVDSSNGGSAHA